MLCKILVVGLPLPRLVNHKPILFAPIDCHCPWRSSDHKRWLFAPYKLSSKAAKIFSTFGSVSLPSVKRV